MARDAFAVEQTPEGEQSLVPGVKPLDAGEKLKRLAAAPLAPGKPQKPCDIGLFDEISRRQRELF
jgi:hypothetical protein